MIDSDQACPEHGPVTAGASMTGPALGAQSPVDWDVMRSLVGEDRDLLLALVDMFPDEGRARLDAICYAIEAGDSELLTRSAHSLKGEARYFGASDLVACAAQAEEYGRASNLPAAEELIPRLKTELARLVDALARERIPE